MKINARALFTTVLAAGLAAGIYTAKDWPVETRLLPWVVGVPGLLLALIQLTLDLVARSRTEETPVTDLIDLPTDRSLPPEVVMRRVSAFYGWFLGLVAGVWLFGFFIRRPCFRIPLSSSPGAGKMVERADLHGRDRGLSLARVRGNPARVVAAGGSSGLAGDLMARRQRMVAGTTMTAIIRPTRLVDLMVGQRYHVTVCSYGRKICNRVD